MKALILNGSKKGDTKLNAVSDFISSTLSSIGYEIDVVVLHDLQIADCTGCFHCWIKTPGVCVIDDNGRNIAMKLIQNDLVVYLTPVIFGGYSSELKKALDRQIPIILPFFMKINGEVHHKPRYERYPAIIAIGVLSSPDEESEKIFETLVDRNAINMHCPAHSAGVVYSTDSFGTLNDKIKTIFIKAGVGR